MKIIATLLIAAVLIGCQHEAQVVTVPEGPNYQAMYLEAKAQLDAARLIHAERTQARDEFMDQLQIQYYKDALQLWEWQRNTGARMHRPAP